MDLSYAVCPASVRMLVAVCQARSFNMDRGARDLFLSEGSFLRYGCSGIPMAYCTATALACHGGFAARISEAEKAEHFPGSLVGSTGIYCCVRLCAGVVAMLAGATQRRAHSVHQSFAHSHHRWFFGFVWGSVVLFFCRQEFSLRIKDLQHHGHRPSQLAF